jgi:hypothetical protein
VLKELTVFICSKVTGLTIGGNVQVGFRAQDAPVRCHTFLESGGALPAFELVDRVDYMLQVATRGETYQQARADAYAIFDAINGTAGWQIPALVSGGQDYEAQVIEALAAPQFIGQDEKGAHEMSCNYMFRMKIAPTAGTPTMLIDCGSFIDVPGTLITLEEFT